MSDVAPFLNDVEKEIILDDALFESVNPLILISILSMEHDSHADLHHESIPEFSTMVLGMAKSLVDSYGKYEGQNATVKENGQVQSSLKISENGIMMNGTQKDAKKEMEKMKCFGCNKLASDLYKNSLPKTFTGDDNRKTVYPRHCNLCFQGNQHFFCSKKCFASGEKIHSKKCKVAQVEENKIFVENLHL